MLDKLQAHLDARPPQLIGKRKDFAILIPLVDGEDGYDLLYEVRSSRVSQAGETSFPGGALEAGETPLDAACRETYEEIGFPQAYIRILGELGALVSDQVRIYVFVGYLPAYQEADFPVNSVEVVKLVRVSLTWLKAHPPQSFQLSFQAQALPDFPWDRIPDGENYAWSRQGHEVVFYPLTPSGLNIWGFTAQMTQTFMEEVEKTYL